MARYPRSRLIQEVRRLSVVNNWRTGAYLATQWLVILAAGGLAIHLGHWAAYVAAMIVIATRQQALGVLLHDATHYLLFTNRTVNDVVSDLCVAFPLGMSTTLYRATHFRHHRYTNSEQDPDLAYQVHDHDWWDWPKSRWRCAWILVKSILGLNLMAAKDAYRQWSPTLNLFKPLPENGGPPFSLRARVLFVLSSVVLYAVLISTGLFFKFLLLYAVPGLTILNLVNRIRATSEHIRVPGTHELNSTRTVIPTVLERLFIAPYHVNYHLEHHIFPSVPGYNLPRLHGLLMQDADFRSKATITRSYVGLIGELMRASPD